MVIENATKTQSRMTDDHFCINININKELRNSIFINEDDVGTWEQEIVYENLLIHCAMC